jgi:hypothetical protein
MAWRAKPECVQAAGSNARCGYGCCQSASLYIKVPASRHRPLVTSRIALYHYVTKISVDLKDKVNPGGGVPLFTRDIDVNVPANRSVTNYQKVCAGLRR